MNTNHCSDIEEFIAALEKRRNQLIEMVTMRHAQGGRTEAMRKQIKELQAQILQELILLQKCKKRIPKVDAADPIAPFTLKVQIVNIHYSGPDTNGRLMNKNASLTEVFTTLNEILRIYPISHINCTGIETIDWSRQLNFDENKEALLQLISTLRTISGSNALYIGILPAQTDYDDTCRTRKIGTGVCLLAVNSSTAVQAIAPVMDQKEIFADSIPY